MQLKNIFLVGIVLMTSCELRSQSKVEFKDFSWAQAKKEALKQNKFLFVDVVGSLERADQEKQADKILSVDSIAGLINDNFLSIRLDMSSTEGSAFAPSLQMLMYPAFVFFDAQGDQIGNSSRYELEKNTEKFIDVVYHAIQKGELKKKNNGSINFLVNQETDWQSVLKVAEQEDKLIFIDAYTKWCRPCIQMDRDIFTLNEVADFYNANFVSLKLDASKTYGPELVKKYEVKGFPTFLFVDAKGKLIHSESGFKKKEIFLKLGTEALKKTDAKTSKIDFLEDAFQVVMEKARTENKTIFFDAYTTWCGPCKQMDRDVFSNDEVASFFNENFVNAKYDMEMGEGSALKDKYDINVFPTYLFLDAEGNIRHRITGSMPVDKLIAEGQKVLDGEGETSSAMDGRFLSGERSEEFLLAYISILSGGSRYKKVEEVTSLYLNAKEKDALLEPDNWTLFRDHISDPFSTSFKFFLANLNTFEVTFGEAEVSRKLIGTLVGGARKYFHKNKEFKLIKFDKSGFIKYVNFVAGLELEKEDLILTYMAINKARENSNWGAFVSTIEKGFSKNILTKTSFVLYNYANTLNLGENVPKKHAYTGAEWVAECMVSDPSPHARNNYLRLYADLLEKSDKEKDAKKARQQIN